MIINFIICLRMSSVKQVQYTGVKVVSESVKGDVFK